MAGTGKAREREAARRREFCVGGWRVILARGGGVSKASRGYGGWRVVLGKFLHICYLSLNRLS